MHGTHTACHHYIPAYAAVTLAVEAVTDVVIDSYLSVDACFRR